MFPARIAPQARLNGSTQSPSYLRAGGLPRRPPQQDSTARQFSTSSCDESMPELRYRATSTRSKDRDLRTCGRPDEDGSGPDDPWAQRRGIDRFEHRYRAVLNAAMETTWSCQQAPTTGAEGERASRDHQRSSGCRWTKRGRTAKGWLSGGTRRADTEARIRNSGFGQDRWALTGKDFRAVVGNRPPCAF